MTKKYLFALSFLSMLSSSCDYFILDASSTEKLENRTEDKSEDKSNEIDEETSSKEDDSNINVTPSKYLYKASFISNGGNIVSPIPINNEGKLISRPVFERKGYELDYIFVDNIQLDSVDELMNHIFDNNATIIPFYTNYENMEWTIDESKGFISGYKGKDSYICIPKKLSNTDSSQKEKIINDKIINIDTNDTRNIVLYIPSNVTVDDYYSNTKYILSPYFINQDNKKESYVKKVVISSTNEKIFNFNSPQLVTYNADSYKLVAGNEFSSFEGVNYIGSRCFTEHHVETVYMPDTVKYIGSFCFGQCYNLKKVVLSKNLTTIDQQAFAVSGLDYIWLPKSCTNIQSYVFYKCSQNLVVDYEGSKEEFEKLSLYNTNLLEYKSTRKFNYNVEKPTSI